MGSHGFSFLKQLLGIISYYYVQIKKVNLEQKKAKIHKYIIQLFVAVAP